METIYYNGCSLFSRSVCVILYKEKNAEIHTQLRKQINTRLGTNELTLVSTLLPNEE